jgi:hypothetical protein
VPALGLGSGGGMLTDSVVELAHRHQLNQEALVTHNIYSLRLPNQTHVLTYDFLHLPGQLLGCVEVAIRSGHGSA